MPELHLIVPGSIHQKTGGYIYDARMVAGLQRLGWRVSVHSLDGEFPDADAVARDSFARTLAALPDRARVVVDGLAAGGLPGPLQAHRARLRLLALVHHPLADESGLEPGLRERFDASERAALAACAGVLVTSRFTATRLAAYGVSPARVRAVPPGIDPARPAEGPAPGAPPRLLCVASLVPRKGQDVLVRALMRLRDIGWTCVCAGSLTRAPAYATAVKNQVQAAGLEDRVDFPGECTPESLDSLYHASSLFVLPSRFEGYGMALTEALARGLPVVSTTGGAIPDTVPPEAGFLVPVGDEAALADAVRGLLSDGDGGGSGTSAAQRRERMGAAARRYAASLPDWDQAARAFAVAAQELAPDGDV